MHKFTEYKPNVAAFAVAREKPNLPSGFRQRIFSRPVQRRENFTPAPFTDIFPRLPNGKTLKRLRSIIPAALLAAGIALHAAPSSAATSERAPVAALNAALIAAMKAGAANASFQSRYAALEPVLKTTYDLPAVLQNSVGFLWPTLPAAQQNQLARIFEQYITASYVNGFNSYGGQNIVLLPTERDVGAEVVVETQIQPADGSAPTRLDYVMTKTGGGWLVSDVLLNGTISKVAVQSSDFSSLVTDGDASQLITALQAKVAYLSGGALKD
jgi:phospholipid transport system substrate-binding protein